MRPLPLPVHDHAAARRAMVIGVALTAALPFAAAGQAVRTDPPHGPAAPLAERVFGLMGKRIHSPGGTEIGRVVDLVVDAQGRTRAAVVDVGGFLGIGSRRIALAWERMSLRIDEGAMRIETDVAAERISAAPEYRPGDPASIFDPAAED